MMDGSDKISDGEVKMNCNKTFLTLLKLQNSEIRILNISCMYFVVCARIAVSWDKSTCPPGIFVCAEFLFVLNGKMGYP